MSTPHVIVVGGGVAGIAAALDCADAGARVTLFEVRPRLGGAAYSFEREGLTLDNGQHVFLRCCTAYRQLLARLGSDALVRLQPRLEIPVLSPSRDPVLLRRGTLPHPLQRCSLPAPLHLAGALLRYPHLTLRERLSAVRGARAIARLDREEALRLELERNCTLGEWLAAHGQGRRSVDRLWDLIALPTLNLPAREASLALGAFVLQTGLLEHADAGDIGFHAHPLSETIGEPALHTLKDAGVDVRLQTRVEEVRASDGGPNADGASLEVLTEGKGHDESGDGKVQGDAAIVAVPPVRAADMLGRVLGERVAAFRSLGSSPVVNVYVVYDRRVCDHEFAAGVRTPVQYVFDRTAAAGVKGGQCLAVSISAAEREMQMSATELREHYLAALAELFPRAVGAQVRACAASREHAATFAARPGVERHRPQARTSVPGLALAGAWTATGWPATLEGATRSGHAAAQVVLESVGRSPQVRSLSARDRQPSSPHEDDRPKRHEESLR
jgi:hydroxysqualene dehydroxylase